MTVICIMLTDIICCNSQTMKVGSDLLSGLCFKSANISTSYSFAQKWSAGADIEMNLKTIIRQQEDIVSDHLKDLSITEESTHMNRSIESFQKVSIYIDYWLEDTFKGAYIRLGGDIRDREGPDMTIGVGYTMRIWKGLGIETGYNLGVIDALNKQKLSADGLKAGFYYVF